jgi:hypothetical protein
MSFRAMSDVKYPGPDLNRGRSAIPCKRSAMFSVISVRFRTYE